jgi:hypothetical protein
LVLQPGTNEPIERSENLPVVCSYCKKWDSEENKAWDGWIGKNEYYFKTFIVSYGFHVLPRAGGVDDQDPHLLDIFVLLKTVFDKHVQLDNAMISARLLGAMRGR